MNIADSIAKKIDSLPPLPDTIIKIQEICNNPKSSSKDLVDVVEKDPLLTANLLRVANSPYYGFTSKITSIAHAISLFGMTTVLGFALSSAVRKSFTQISLKPYGITTDDFSLSSYRQNKLMINWHFYLKVKNATILVPASFVNEIGKVVIAQIIEERELTEEFYDAIKVADNYFQVEKDFLSITTPEVSAKILYKWRIDANVVYAILSSLEPEAAAEPLKTYGYAIHTCREVIGPKGEVSKESVKKGIKILAKAGLSKNDFLNALRRTFK